MNTNWLNILNEAEKEYNGGATKVALSLYCNVMNLRLADLDAASETIGRTGDVWLDTDAHVLERICDIACLHGDFDLAINALSLAAQAADAVGNAFFWTYSQLRIAEIYFETGIEDGFWEAMLPFEEKLGDDHYAPKWGAELERSERDFLSIRWHFLYAKWLGGLGKYLAAQGHIAKAQQAMEALAASSQFFELAQEQIRPIKIAQAKFALEMGSLGDTLNLVEELLVGEKDFDLKEQQLVGSIRFYVAFLRGDFGNAITWGFDLVRLADLAGGLEGCFASRMNLAQVLLILNQLPDLETVLGQLSQISNANAAYVGDVAKLKRWVYLRKEASATAYTTFPLEQVGDWEAVFEPTSLNHQMHGHSYLARFDAAGVVLMEWITQHDLAKVEAHLAYIHREFGDSDSMLVRHRLAVLLWLSGYNFGTKRKDADLLAAITFFQSEGLLPELFQAKRMLLWSGRLEESAYRHELDENELVLRQMTKSLSPDRRALYLTNKWTERERYLAIKTDQLEHRWGQMGGVRSLFYWRSILQELAGVFQDFDQHKWEQIAASADDQHLLRMANVSRPGWWSVLSSLQFRSATVLLIALPDRLVCVVIGIAFLKIKTVRLSRLKLRELLSGLHVRNGEAQKEVRDLGIGQVQGHARDSFEGIRFQLAEIASALDLEGLLANLPTRVRHLNLVLDDVLYHLPFAALPFQGKYLVERFSLAIQPRAIAGKRRKRFFGSAYLFGVSKGFAQHPALPAVQEELQQVESILKKNEMSVVPELDHGVDKEKILAAMCRASILHIASHGHFSQQEPLQSGIALQGETRLTLGELLDLEKPIHVGVVMLTSCWGADNLTLPSRWILSLPEAIWLAGAGSVVSNLWQVSDDDVAPVVESFYQNLPYDSTSRALQKAQQAILCDPRLCHPFYWSGFQVYGEELSLRCASRVRHWRVRLKRILGG